MSNSKDFSGKVVIITGSTSGIGEGIAIYLSKLGANVVITGRREEELKRVAKICESVSPKLIKPLEVVGDITNDEHSKNLINETINTFGKLDVLVNNAGGVVGSFATFESADSLKIYESTMRLNTRSPVYLSHLAVPYLKKTKGNIVNISSGAALKPISKMFSYCMSKAALDMFTKCLAIELGPKAIRVNAINVGPVKSGWGKSRGIPDKQMEKLWQDLSKATAVGRMGEPHDIALTVAFLASNDASFITGTCMTDDGGSLYSAANSNFHDTLKE